MNIIISTIETSPLVSKHVEIGRGGHEEGEPSSPRQKGKPWGGFPLLATSNTVFEGKGAGGGVVPPPGVEFEGKQDGGGVVPPPASVSKGREPEDGRQFRR